MATPTRLMEHAEFVPLDTLVAFEGNPRRGNVAEIKKSLRRLGQYRTIVVNRGSLTGRPNEVLAGNHTLLAARELGWQELGVEFVDVDEDTAKRIVVVDNRAPDLATNDEQALWELLSSLPDLEGTGYDVTALDELLGDAGMTPGKDTEPKPTPDEPRTRPGDLYLLGDHRLLCGDSTDPDDVRRLLEDGPADLIFTDPPYGMSYRASSGDFAVMKGDQLCGEALTRMVTDALALAAAHRAPGAAAYVWCTWRTYPEFLRSIVDAGLEPSGCIVWKKGRPGPGNAHYRPEHEFCLYCRPEADNDHDFCVYCAGTTWETGRGETDVWEVPRDTGYVHPTQKPVALAERALEHTTKRGRVVLDLFGGSGSTLIACANLKRRARLLELDPAYVDVIVDRWERHTGQEAVLSHVDAQETAPRAPATSP